MGSKEAGQEHLAGIVGVDRVGIIIWERFYRFCPPIVVAVREAAGGVRIGVSAQPAGAGRAALALDDGLRHALDAIVLVRGIGVGGDLSVGQGIEHVEIQKGGR